MAQDNLPSDAQDAYEAYQAFKAYKTRSSAPKESPQVATESQTPAGHSPSILNGIAQATIPAYGAYKDVMEANQAAGRGEGLPQAMGGHLRTQAEQAANTFSFEQSPKVEAGLRAFFSGKGYDAEKSGVDSRMQQDANNYPGAADTGAAGGVVAQGVAGGAALKALPGAGGVRYTVNASPSQPLLSAAPAESLAETLGRAGPQAASAVGHGAALLAKAAVPLATKAVPQLALLKYLLTHGKEQSHE
jgi:hypothetical protein